MKNQNNKISPVLSDTFSVRSDIYKRAHKPASVFDRSIFVLILTAFCVMVDYASLSISWNAALRESAWYVVVLMAISSAVVLDVPPAIAAAKVKEYRQGLLSKKNMLFAFIPSSVCVLLVLAFSIAFKIVTRNATFEDTETSSGLVNTLNTKVGNTESVSVFMAALFASILPLATSLMSFVVSYNATDTKGKRIQQCELAKMRVESYITHVDQAITESKNTKRCHELQLDREKDLFDQFTDEVLAGEQKRKQSANQALEEHLNTPNAVSKLTEHGKIINQSYSYKPSDGLIKAVEESVSEFENSDCNPEAADVPGIYHIA